MTSKSQVDIMGIMKKMSRDSKISNYKGLYGENPNHEVK
jgi:hypothetical protein